VSVTVNDRDTVAVKDDDEDREMDLEVLRDIVPTDVETVVVNVVDFVLDLVRDCCDLERDFVPEKDTTETD
jgi:hypothetical protein